MHTNTRVRQAADRAHNLTREQERDVYVMLLACIRAEAPVTIESLGRFVLEAEAPAPSPEFLS